MAGASSEESFRAVFEPHRRSITLHCYRMLGSLQDAEEIVQDTLLRAWQRQGDLRSSALRPWLYQIATNACLDHLRKARRRRALPHLVAPPTSVGVAIGAAADERLWLEPIADALLDVAEVADEAPKRPDQRVPLRESVGLAFIGALQWLSPKQRAALLLVDVLDWQAQEVAALLETSQFSVNSLLQRARKTIAAKRLDSPPAALTIPDGALLQRFIQAWESGDAEALRGLLTEDAIFSMPPQPEWFRGRDSISQFFAAMWSARPGGRRLVPLQANGGPAVAVYRRLQRPQLGWEPSGLTLLTLREGRISQLTRFGSAALFPLFGLPNQPPSA